MSSAADAAFASLTAGVTFSAKGDSNIDQQRKLFERNDQSKTTRAVPVVIASDGSIIADPEAFQDRANVAANIVNLQYHGAGALHSNPISIHSLIANLPPPRLDFISKNARTDNTEENKKKHENVSQDGETNNNKKKDESDDDDAQDQEEAAAAAAMKPTGRKHMGNYLTKHDITVKGKNYKTPGAAPVEYLLSHLSELLRAPFNISKTIINNLFERQLTKPTVIQSLAMPLLMSKRNVLACAPTGSGKTISFLIPMFSILKKPNPSLDATVRALIVAPTKELAAQIEREAQFLMKGAPWRVVHYGHTTKGKDVFITTPQRAVSMAEQNVISLQNVEYIVFDEGDKLWEQGSDFTSQAKQILAFCGCDVSKINSIQAQQQSAAKNKNNKSEDDAENKDRDDDDDEKPSQISNNNKTIAFFSATLPAKTEKLARAFMPDPVLVLIKGRAHANTDCDQKLVFTGNEIGKITAIKNMISDGELKPPVLIFVQSIERSKELYDEIRASGLRVAVLNAQMNSDDRDKVVLKFRMGEIWVLITTELLARGVDFKGVHTVINFDLPLTPEAYVHRIGRTGRAGKRGNAITFFTEDDKLRLPPIVKIIHESGNEVAPYLLELKQPTQKQLKHLERSVPKRLAVSTKKRARIGEDRIMRMANAYCRKEEDDDDDDEQAEEKIPQKKNNRSASQKSGNSNSNAAQEDGPRKRRPIQGKKKIPNRSEQFE